MNENNSVLTPSSVRKNLVIVCAGDSSYHPFWLSKKRSFDLMIIYYGDSENKFKEQADYYFHIKDGLKLNRIKRVVNSNLDLIEKYTYVSIPDDDLLMYASQWEKLFSAMNEYHLDLGHPALISGQISHPNHYLNPKNKIRYVNFIEILCPVFNLKTFLFLLPTFDLTYSGWGVDWIWTQTTKERSSAIIDLVCVHHGFETHSGYYEDLSILTSQSAQEEMDQLTEKYNITKEYVCFGEKQRNWIFLPFRLCLFNLMKLSIKLNLKQISLFFQKYFF